MNTKYLQPFSLLLTFFFIILSFSLFSFLVFWISFAQQNIDGSTTIDESDLVCEPKFYEVTAYYSPLPDQYHYWQWSYEAEKKMNGEWKAWASWKEVFNGMIAAPKNYVFGQKIYIDGFGRGEVSDRWWAIVTAADNENTWLDRIDIWAWYGEEWLMRALTIGRKVVEWKSCDSTFDVQVWFDFPADNLLKHFFKISLYDRVLIQWDKNIRVYELNSYLAGLWYKIEKTPNYTSETKNAICSFQQAQDIYTSSDPRCGVFDVMTQALFKQAVIDEKIAPTNIRERTTYPTIKKYIDDIMLWENTVVPLEDKTVVTTTPKNISVVTYDFSSLERNFSRTYKIGETVDDILYLHIKLTLMWYYKGPLTRTYSAESIQAVYDFQVAHGILDTYADRSEVRGTFWPVTRKTLNNYKINDIIYKLLWRS